MLTGIAMMVREKYTVRLAQEEWEELRGLSWVGKHPAGVTARARILIKSNDGWPAPQLAEALEVALGTVYRVRRRLSEEGLARVRPQANRRRQLDDRGGGHLINLGCGPPPASHDLWILRVLVGKGGRVEVGILHVPRRGAPASQKNALKPWQKKEWCIPKVSADFVAHYGGSAGPIRGTL